MDLNRYRSKQQKDTLKKLYQTLEPSVDYVFFKNFFKRFMTPDYDIEWGLPETILRNYHLKDFVTVYNSLKELPLDRDLSKEL